MKKLSNIKAELKKDVAYKKSAYVPFALCLLMIAFLLL